MSARRVLSLLLVAALAAATAVQDAAAMHPSLCPDGVYVLDGPPLLPGGKPSSFDTVTIDHGSMSIGSGCSAVQARIVQPPRGGYIVRANWEDCSGLAKRVRLRARLLPGCGLLRGRFSTCEPPLLRRFTAEPCQHDCPRECDVTTPCGGNQFCELPPGVCASALDGGTCTPIPQACPDVWIPECGCDGKTYSNSCDRQAAGVSLSRRGRCDCELACPPGLSSVDEDFDGCPERCEGACSDPCDCYENPDLVLGPPCECAGCGNFWLCESGTCAEHCGLIPPMMCEQEEPVVPRRCVGP